MRAFVSKHSSALDRMGLQGWGGGGKRDIYFCTFLLWSTSDRAPGRLANSKKGSMSFAQPLIEAVILTYPCFVVIHYKPVHVFYRAPRCISSKAR